MHDQTFASRNYDRYTGQQFKYWGTRTRKKQGMPERRGIQKTGYSGLNMTDPAPRVGLSWKICLSETIIKLKNITL
ncbi:hypothetical protein H8L32_12985 [Undibacterium sp. CY18W]|uniref:Uncharacterized protein n=1 Tax=Undibacterium hunanense TaxID=2762292 RepID=A0ABR6ZR85_9BURK|nr:hypothetical protein [Undibacterium hunanense]MBC3918400.1 hypothetical protein [Undibacterium hunanense]